jgi:hypothetical protein
MHVALMPYNHIITVMSQIEFERPHYSSCIKNRDESVTNRICTRLCHLPHLFRSSAHTDVHLEGRHEGEDPLAHLSCNA